MQQKLEQGGKSDANLRIVPPLKKFENCNDQSLSSTAPYFTTSSKHRNRTPIVSKAVISVKKIPPMNSPEIKPKKWKQLSSNNSNPITASNATQLCQLAQQINHSS